MSKWFLTRGICAALLLLAVSALLPTQVDATHSWAGHWRRTSSAIRNIPVRRFLSSTWLTRYNTAMTDWRKAAMTKIKPYTAITGGPRSTCPYLTGYITVCDANYGNTGWGGLAQLWVDGAGHNLWGRAWLNNYYVVGSSATVVAWRQHLVCHEIGHLFGLDHVNEIMTNRNTGSCMDYTNDPDGGSGGYPGDPNNMHPNAHDYSVINARHNHIGSLIPGFGAPEMDTPQAMSLAMKQFDVKTMRGFGHLVYSANEGVADRYQLDLPSGGKVTTWVFKVPLGR